MQEHDLGIGGYWWRFSDYQIKEVPSRGDVNPRFSDYFRYIVPAPGAKLEQYEPLIGKRDEEFDVEGEPGVVGLASLRDLDLENENAIVSWCQRFGLLGILPQRAMLIRLAPRWQPIVDDRDPMLFPSQVSYSRTNIGWRRVPKTTMIGKNSGSMTLEEGDRMEDHRGTLVEPEYTNHPQASVIIAQLFTNEYEEKKLGDTIGPYFPNMPHDDWDTLEYPMPFTDDFWWQYGESVGEFRHTIQDFLKMVDRLGILQGINDAPEEEMSNFGQAYGQLHALCAVNPGLGITEEGHPVPRWAFSSLLAIFAFSVLQELWGGKSVRHCARPRCRKVYISGNSRRKFCSDRCRLADEKARQRSRQSK